MGFLNKLLDFIKSLLSGHAGSHSSKRFVGIVGAFILYSVLVYNAIMKVDLQLNTTLVDSITYVVIAALGSTAVERFAKKEEK